MQPVQFHQAIEVIRRQDPRFDPSAYFFLKEALDFTLKKAQEQAAPGSSPHVTGAQLLAGFRELALQDFGLWAGDRIDAVHASIQASSSPSTA